MLGFDRGGAYAQVFRHCRDQDVHWVTYRRAPLAVPAMLPVITTATIAGRPREITWAEETVQLKDYGEARQITLFEHGKVALQILTSDSESCPAEILAAAIAARDQIPAKLPANVIDPDAEVALLRTRRRGLQMVLRLLAHNVEHWLSNQLNAYLRDDDEYRAATRQTIIRGLAGTITYTPAAITVTLETPGTPRVARALALALLIDEINQTPPAMPGDPRPITYKLARTARTI